MSEIDRVVAEALLPARAPESLWYRVDAQLRYLQNPGRRNRLPHPALQTFGEDVLVGQAVSPARCGVPRAARRLGPARLALAFAVMLVAVVSVGWYLDRPAQPGSSVSRPLQLTRGEHSCLQCHV
jgi:hypothetical protein